MGKKQSLFSCLVKALSWALLALFKTRDEFSFPWGNTGLAPRWELRTLGGQELRCCLFTAPTAQSLRYRAWVLYVSVGWTDGWLTWEQVSSMQGSQAILHLYLDPSPLHSILGWPWIRVEKLISSSFRSSHLAYSRPDVPCWHYLKLKPHCSGQRAHVRVGAGKLIKK